MTHLKTKLFIFIVLFGFTSSELMAQTRRSSSSRTKTKTSSKRGQTRTTRTVVKRTNGQKTRVVQKKRKVVVRNNVRLSRRSYKRTYNRRTGYHPYRYHVYTPYRFGPRWYARGYVRTSMVASVIILSHNDAIYYYDDGVYYVPVRNGYRVVYPPPAIVIRTIPSGREKVVLNDVEYYYFGGVFYRKQLRNYVVVNAPDGAIVSNLPEGGEEYRVGENTYVLYNNAYYLPITVDEKDVYQVVEMETF